MSKALKCDRCKNYYDPYKHMLTIMYADKIARDGGCVDLCPGCLDLLERWLKEYEVSDEAADQRTDESL